MTPRGKRRLIIGTALLVIVGTAGYLVYRYFKNKGDEDAEPTKTPSDEAPKADSPKLDDTTPKSSANPFSTSDELKRFQQYVLNVEKDLEILGKGKDDGKWGKSSASAWEKYGKRFQEWQKKNPTMTDYAKFVQSIPTNARNVYFTGNKITVDIKNTKGENIGSVEFLQNNSFSSKLNNGTSVSGTWSNSGQTIIANKVCRPQFPIGNVVCGSVSKLFQDPKSVNAINQLITFISKG